MSHFLIASIAVAVTSDSPVLGRDSSLTKTLPVIISALSARLTARLGRNCCNTTVVHVTGVYARSAIMEKA